MSDEQSVRQQAMSILKTARVSNSRVNYTGFITWKDRDQMQAAFDLFNEHSGMGPMLSGCAPCHSKVFNWLMGVALEAVEVGQMDITNA